ncbi:hypothetical protein [Zoogloea sp.]|uniref:hypothetical protein n=1 Tax=Zoogloea sp. TaxID=49181 RepID=UPI0031FD8C9E
MSGQTVGHTAGLMGACLALTLALGSVPVQADTQPRGSAYQQRLASADSSPATPLALPRAKDFNGSSLGLSDCQVAQQLTPGSVLAVCRDKKADRRNDRGLRLILARSDDERPRIILRGPGGGDAYTATFTAFALPHSAGQILLVDFAAEFHYGTQVFYLPEEGKPRLAGSIDGVALDDDQEAASPTRYARVSGDPGGFNIRFDRPLVRIGRDGLPGEAQRASYRYEAAAGRWTRNKN